MSRPVPIVVTSRCLGFDACRYDGEIVDNDFVAKLRRFVRVVPVCPELEVGLGVPRPPIRIVDDGRAQRLIQPDVGREMTGAMQRFARAYLDSQARSGVDGFILKSRSPSCGVHDTKFFPDVHTDVFVSLGSGMFAREVLARFADLAIEDEARLADPEVRRAFLRRLFALAARREGVTPLPHPGYPAELSV